MKKNKIPSGVLWSCILGHGLEMYDFTLYGAFTTVISLHFFSHDENDFSLIPALFALSAGYVARPLGAILFGYIGDIYGRKKSLIFTMLIASLATGVIGLSPSYALIGVFSTTLLFIARFFQGLCAGAETSDASIFLIEHCHYERSSYGSAMIFLSGGVGCLLALLTSKIFIGLEFSWAWRIPFMIGLSVGVLVLYLRYNVQESSEFINTLSRNPVLNILFFKKLIQNHSKALTMATSFGFLSGITSTTIVVFVNLYLHKTLGLEMSYALSFSVYGMIPFIISCFCCSKIPSNYVRNKVIKASIFGLILFACPYFYLLGKGVYSEIFLAQIVLGILAGSFIAPVNSLLANQFPPQVRCTGVSVGYNTGYAATSGLYPIFAFKLIEITGNIYSPALFLFFFGLIALTILVRKDTYDSHVLIKA